MTRQKKIFSAILYWLILNAGTLMLAAGVYFFKAPNNFATGGVSGIAILLSRLPIPLRQSHWVMIINALLLVFGFLFLGKGCTVKTIYCSLVYSGENLLFEYICPLSAPLTNEPFLELVYAMLLTGVGSAIIFYCGASSGGTDIVALILKKYTKLDTGNALLATDFLIAFSTFFLFGIQAGLYSVLGLFSKAFIVDGIIESMGKSKYITVITSSPAEIERYILHEMNRSFTRYEAVGGYTHEAKTILITVCKRSEAIRLKAKVKQFDPDSFVIITDANEILGKGFRQV
ncbi:MAG: YitT family protein [Christensenellaceae bacterium]